MKHRLSFDVELSADQGRKFIKETIPEDAFDGLANFFMINDDDDEVEFTNPYLDVPMS